ncbi:MAG: pilus assembly protein TadG-related protein [Bacillota bacterium]
MLHKTPNEKGYITIYLLIILLALIFFLGLLIDLSRIRIAQNQVRRAANSAARSVLAEYDSPLKNGYGLFAMTSSLEQERRKDFDRYLCLNLKESQEFSLLDYHIEESSLILIRPLSDTAVLQQQILEEMKYRAPLDITEELFNRINDIGGFFGVFSKAEKEKENLKKVDDGLDDIKQSNKKIKELSEQRKLLKGKIQQKEKNLNDLEKRYANTGDNENKRALENEIYSLRQDIKKDRGMLDQYRGDIRKENSSVRNKRDEIEEVIARIDSSGSLDNSGADPNQGQWGGAVAEAEKAFQESLSQYTGVIKEGLEINCPSGSIDAIANAVNEESFDAACGGIAVSNGPEYESPLAKEAKSKSEEAKNTLNSLKSGPCLETVNSFETGGESSLRASDVIETNKKILGFLNVEEQLIKCRDEIFINEFILGERGNKNRFDNLAANNFDTDNADSEYIICGSWIKALEQVWMVRFAMDVPAYFVLRFKTLGPVWGTVASLVVGAVQASVDTNNLLKNEEIGIAEVYPPDERLQKIKINYRDMLRIVALINSDKEGKLIRTSEKISQKAGADLSRAPTAAFGDVTVSIRLWFLPAVGIQNIKNGPFGTFISKGRCYITKDVLYSY